MTHPFAFIATAPNRTAKPRQKGLTMLADVGMTLPELEAMLELGGDYIDLAKFFAGSARLYDEAYLVAKLDLYRSNGVRTYPGGAFLEHALAAGGFGNAKRFLDEVKRLGFAGIEVSDQTTVLTASQRGKLIEDAIRMGLAVFAEVGSKAVSVADDRMAEQAHIAFEAGAEIVTIEAGELLKDGKPNAELVESLSRNLDIERLMFEIPGPAVVGMTLSQAQELKRFLIRTYGPNVNLGNIRVIDLIDTEVRRLGLGPSGKLFAGTKQNVVAS
jgi:phosphosulfolactate synthase